jgi:MoaA/NifB/PqqE/SkfB family radical SAM enzyme
VVHCVKNYSPVKSPKDYSPQSAEEIDKLRKEAEEEKRKLERTPVKSPKDYSPLLCYSPDRCCIVFAEFLILFIRWRKHDNEHSEFFGFFICKTKNLDWVAQTSIKFKSQLNLKCKLIL